MKISKKWLWIIVPLVILLPTQYLNHTGFCYSEMRYLNERELLDYFIFGSKATVMSEEEKKAIVAQRWNGAVYPDCCRITDEPFWLRSSPFRFWDKTLVGQYLYQVTYHAPDMRMLANSSREPFMEYNSALNSCGTAVKGDSPSIDINEIAYKNALEQNKKYWKEYK